MFSKSRQKKQADRSECNPKNGVNSKRSDLQARHTVTIFGSQDNNLALSLFEMKDRKKTNPVHKEITRNVQYRNEHYLHYL